LFKGSVYSIRVAGLFIYRDKEELSILTLDSSSITD